MASTFKFSDFPVRLVDVSKYNDRYETEYKPTFEKLKAAGFRGVSVRVGLGIVKDRMFEWYWEKARGVLDRAPYWYFDFYSHKGKGMSLEEWAVIQAGYMWEWLKHDPGEMPGKLDCENSSFAQITILNASEYARGVKAFIIEYHRLSGQWLEIYCSPGLLWVFGDWFKDRDLWLAWYNKFITWQDILNKVAQFKWRGKVTQWQYASDGDINNDGIADGLTLGMEAAALDLNVFLGTEEEYSLYCGSTPAVVPPVLEDDVDVPIPPVEPGAVYRTVQIKLTTDYLNLRSAPVAGSGSGVFWVMKPGTPVECIEKITRPGEIWWRVGQGQYCAELYNRKGFLK